MNPHMIYFFYDPQGFYSVYRGVFESLAEEDYVFMPDRKKEDTFPNFGDSKSDYEEVRTISFSMFLSN